MRTTRGYINVELAVGAEVVLGEELATHLTRVLRLRSGDGLHLFNGDGREFRAVLTSLERKRTMARVEAEITPIAESPLQLHLAQGLCRGEKMDLILQKATELGAAGIQPLLTERTEVRLDAEREARRMQHWSAVLASACEQSGRARLPQLTAPLALPHWLAQWLAPSDTAGITPMRVMLDPEGDLSLAQMPRPSGAVLLAVGPEGGFSEHECKLMRAQGFFRLRLGPRILRTETAGLAALSALQSHWGDW